MANIYHFITISLDFPNNSFCCCVTKSYANEIKKSFKKLLALQFSWVNSIMPEIYVNVIKTEEKVVGF